MNLTNIPFTKLTSNDHPRPWLLVTIISPHTNRKVRLLGLIDTGADECALPARYAPLLGHHFESGFAKEVNTGNGLTIAYSHTVKIGIQDFTIEDTLIDFMPNLQTPLLGVKSFLSNFVLTVDYPKKIFSLQTR